LRPYYIPPTIGEPSAPASAPSPNPLSGGRNATSPGYASKARGVLTDLDYNNYLKESTPSMTQNAQELVDELLRKYASVLTAQPFVVAKMILQVRDQGDNASLSPSAEPEKLKKRTASQGGSLYDVRASENRQQMFALT
jgi:mitochondrial fusion and transport protein UGO1